MKKAGCSSWLLCIIAVWALISVCATSPFMLIFVCATAFIIFCVWAGCINKSPDGQSAVKQDIREPAIPDVDVDQLTGKEYERYVGEKLCRLGYTLIRYTPDSGDYGADIIMKNPDGEKSCIQCKRYKKSVGVSAVQEIVAAKGYYDCTEAVVATTAAFTPSAKELAERNGVRLLEHFR